jgi:hypothetical protein
MQIVQYDSFESRRKWSQYHLHTLSFRPEVPSKLAWLCMREQAALRRKQRHMWNRDQSLQQPEAISMPGTSDGGTTRTRTTDVPGFPLADNTHVTLAHPCRSAPPIDRVDATHRLSLSSGLPFRPAFQPSSPSVGLTPAGRLPFSYTRYFLPHCCPLSLAFLILLRPGPDRQRRPTRA